MSLAPYTAACVRACALRSTLLAPEEWPSLGRLSDAGAVIDRLKTRGVLRDGVTDVLAAERDAHESVIRNATALLRFSRGALAELLRCFVKYYDLLNVASVIQRIHVFPDEHERPQGRFYDTGPLGLLRPATLDAVINYPALRHALRGSLLAAAYDAALLRYREDEDVTRFIERLDLAFFGHWVAAAGRCGIRPREGAGASALSLFFVSRAIEAAIRLKLYREAETSRVAQWLSLVAPRDRVDACLAGEAGADASSLAQELLALLLPTAGGTERVPEQSDTRSLRGILDRAVVQAATKATRGIAFDVDFLTGFLLRRLYQAREVTVLLESKETGLDVESSGQGGELP